MLRALNEERLSYVVNSVSLVFALFEPASSWHQRSWRKQNELAKRAGDFDEEYKYKLAYCG